MGRPGSVSLSQAAWTTRDPVPSLVSERPSALYSK